MQSGCGMRTFIVISGLGEISFQQNSYLRQNKQLTESNFQNFKLNTFVVPIDGGGPSTSRHDCVRSLSPVSFWDSPALRLRFREEAMGRPFVLEAALFFPMSSMSVTIGCDSLSGKSSCDAD